MSAYKKLSIVFICILALLFTLTFCSKKEIPLKATLEFQQLTLNLDDGIHKNTAWGMVKLIYETDPKVPVLFFNLSRNNEWVIGNLPLRSSGTQDRTYHAWIPFGLGVSDGTQVKKLSFGYSVSRTPIKTKPATISVALVVSHTIKLRSGFIGEKIAYQPSLIFPRIIFERDILVDQAFHSVIVNQECGLQECFLAAVSNSLKMLKQLNPEKMSHLSDSANSDKDDTDIETVKKHIDFSEPFTLTDPDTGEVTCSGGCNPAEKTDDPKASWNQKKKWMDTDPRYPIDTKIIDDFSRLDEVINAIKKGCDVELQIPGHAVTISGIAKYKNGDYVLHFVEDTAQGEAGGTEAPPSCVTYNAAKKEFEGHPTFQGAKFEGPGKGAPLFVIECVQ